MKRIILVFMWLFAAGALLGQTPQSFNYQASLNDADGNLLVEQSIGVKMSILIGSAIGDPVYEETHTTETNAAGVFAVRVGSGDPLTGTFEDINWGANAFYLKVEVDPNGESNYVHMGTTQMVSVPYALYAEESASSPESKWQLSGQNIYYNDGKIGVGTSIPLSRLDVKGNEPTDEPLFQVINANNDTVFAVYPDGVKILVDDQAKGRIGGFAVSGKTPGKTTEERYFKITPDSTIVYIPDATKGKIGGFAVSGRTPGKNKGFSDYFNVSGDAPVVVDPSEPRVLWYPRKEAFWAGRVLIEHPDSVGNQSLSIGYESKAIGSNSQALGFRNVANGAISTAIGALSRADSVNSFAFGLYARAGDKGAFAFGNRSKAMGESCFAFGGEARNQSGAQIGRYTFADGTASFALGLGAHATGIANTAFGLETMADGEFGATALGIKSRAAGINSLAMGVEDTAYATGSMAIGAQAVTLGEFSTAMGVGAVATVPRSLVVGPFNEILPYTGIPSQDPIFVVGNGLDKELRSNAITVLQNGFVGIGISQPQVQLHIKDLMRMEPILTLPAGYIEQEGDVFYMKGEGLVMYNGESFVNVTTGSVVSISKE